MLFCGTLVSQNTINIDAVIDVNTKTITVAQTLTYQNDSDDSLSEIYLNDWNNSYSTKSTPLAKRFEEEFSTKFHLAKSEQRGYTVVTSIKTMADAAALKFHHLKDHPDVLKVVLPTPLRPGESYHLRLDYILMLPDATFTDYGITKTKEFELKYWYITPSVYNGKWNYYSNKNLDDLFVPKSDINLSLTHPINYRATSELDVVSMTPDYEKRTQTSIFTGKDRIDTYLGLHKFPLYGVVQTDDFFLISNIDEKGLPPSSVALITDKITRFLTKNIGDYPHNNLLVTRIDYRKNPLYGLNQLPDFLSPFPDEFQYELKLLKTALKKHIDNVLLVNPRTDYWLSDGLQIYFLIKYVEEYYPDMKLLGSLSNIWGI